MVNLSGLVDSWIGFNTVGVFSVILCLFQVYEVSGFECGNVTLVQGLALGGNETIRGEWPFIVALYDSSAKYICGGTLISNKHVLTAAHCVPRSRSPDGLKVRLGAYNITRINETGSVERSVSEILIHPDRIAYSDDYYADISILILTENVTFSRYIQPVCMPPIDVITDPASIDISGTVVGWGLAEEKIHEDIPRKFVAQSFNNSNCYRMDPGISTVSSNRTFCAKSEDATANKGDSGGGFFAVSNGYWVQYGIVAAVRTKKGHAAINSFAVYTNVQLFKEWIVQSVRRSGGDVGESTMIINLKCEFRYDDFFGYLCEVNDFNSSNEYTENVSISGEHLFSESNDRVRLIRFKSGNLYTLPVGIGNFFKNVEYLVIGNDKSSSFRLKYFERKSLQNLENLLGIVVSNGDYEILDEDCLWDLPNLKFVSFSNCKITELKDKFFNGNQKLSGVNLSQNRLETLPKNLFERNVVLEYLNLSSNSLVTVAGEIFKTNTQLKEVDLSSNKLEFLPKNFFENQFSLDTLILSRNSLQLIDGQIFRDNLNLKNIDLSSNQLESLPSDLFESNSLLERIDLDENSIMAIDGRIFENNLKLAIVYLMSNRLESLPTTLFENNLLLEEVNLEDNLLRSIDERFFEKNANLTVVSLSSNPIGVMSRILLKDKSKLTFVDLRDMSLTMIDEHFFETHLLLREVYLSSNKLESVPKHLFEKNPLLEWVILSMNSLKTIGEELFAANANLQEVYLSSNQLETLPKNLFRNNPLLRVVRVDNNFLEAIDEQIFENNSAILELYFNGNRLETLPRDLFKNTLLLESANFNRNRLRRIEPNFTKLKNVKWISFYENICIDVRYYADMFPLDDESQTNSLINLQGLLNAKCNATNDLNA